MVNALQANGVEVRQSPTNPRQFAASCPCHDDTDPSLSIGDAETAVVVRCWAGCEQQEVFDAVVGLAGLHGRDFFYEQRRQAPPAGTPHVTLAQLAEAKKLPVDWFAQFRISDADTGINMPYYSEAGRLVGTRRRHALRASEGSSWQPAPGETKVAVSAYGAWALPRIRQGGELILVEGETDTITGWWHHLPVLGLPGKASARRALRNTPGLFNGIERVFVIEEPDDRPTGAFQRGIRRAMSELRYGGEFFVMRLPVKDLSQLHIDTNGDHEAFMAAFDQSVSAALDLASWPAPGRVGHEHFRVANWVRKTRKTTFGVKDCFNAAKDEMSWTEIAEAFQALEDAGWVRSLPHERRRGRPSPKYRRNPGLEKS